MKAPRAIRRIALVGWWASLVVAGSVYADGPIGDDGEPIETSDYSIDVARGSVLSSSRVTGLAGAFGAIGPRRPPGIRSAGK